MSENDEGIPELTEAERILTRATESDVETGQRFTIAAATIKAHDTYNGVDQTIIKRPTRLPCSPRRTNDLGVRKRCSTAHQNTTGRGINKGPFDLASW